MKRLVVVAIEISDPGSMGGNTKILLELVRNFPAKHQCIVITSKPETFQCNGIVERDGLTIQAISPHHNDTWLNHAKVCSYFVREVRAQFDRHLVGKDDLVYCASDYFHDVIPAFLLQPKYHYTWLPSYFLFLPFIFENLWNRYHFPPIKYLIAYFYQRTSLMMILKRCVGVIITNSSDKKHFPKRLHDKILPIYGGVNTEQIPTTANPSKIYDAIFCSRLHPQKGISGLLDIWATVITAHPTAKLAIIGNGEPTYEAFLRKKATQLNINDNIEWLGYVNNTEKYELYQQSKMLVHATVYDNNGMVAAEALCTGLPVIMYDLPALRHVYSEGCLKIQEGRPDLYAEAIVKLLGDDSELAAISPTAPQIASLRQKWDWQHRTNLFIDFLKQF